MVLFRKRVVGLTEPVLARFVTRAGHAAGLRGAVSLLVTGNREMQRLNREFRSKDKPTDVLSFPAGPAAERGFAGDVAVSAEIAAQNARLLGHSTAQEVKILVLHGVLHLAGYDHETDRGQMVRKEERLRERLGLPHGLIARSSRPARKSVVTKGAKRTRMPRKAAR